MEQSPSGEAKRFSASQEIPRILWNPNVYYRIHNSPPPHPHPIFPYLDSDRAIQSIQWHFDACTFYNQNMNYRIVIESRGVQE